jgi:hypothetical protein
MDGKDVYKIESLDGGKKTFEYYDALTGYLVKESSAEQGAIMYGNYKEAGLGYFIPHSVEINAEGQVIKTTVETADINKGIDDSNFK